MQKKAHKFKAVVIFRNHSVFKFFVETKNKCILFRVTGEVTANEIMTQAAQYIAGEQTGTSLWDFTQATHVKITLNDCDDQYDFNNRQSPSFFNPVPAGQPRRRRQGPP